MNRYAMVFSAVSAITIAGCGGGGSDSTSSEVSDLQTGFFIDGEVEGLNYQCKSASGVTGADGSFKYKSGETVKFSIGDYLLGEAYGDKYITPIDLVAGINANDDGTRIKIGIDNENVLKMVRTLKTISSNTNQDSSNIFITEQNAEKFGSALSSTGLSFIELETSDIISAFIETDISNEFIDEEQAKIHFISSMENIVKIVPSQKNAQSEYFKKLIIPQFDGAKMIIEDAQQGVEDITNAVTEWRETTDEIVDVIRFYEGFANFKLTKSVCNIASALAGKVVENNITGAEYNVGVNLTVNIATQIADADCQGVDFSLNYIDNIPLAVEAIAKFWRDSSEIQKSDAIKTYQLAENYLNGLYYFGGDQDVFDDYIYSNIYHGLLSDPPPVVNGMTGASVENLTKLNFLLGSIAGCVLNGGEVKICADDVNQAVSSFSDFNYNELKETVDSSTKRINGIYILTNVESNNSPVVSISTPSTGTTYTTEDSISFSGTVTDEEDGDLSGGSLVWTSNIDGEIGTDTSFSKDNLSIGTHTITLTATDSANATD